MSASPAQPLVDWFASRDWSPFAFQHETWGAYLRGESGLLHAPTGTGKTFAVWGGPLIEALKEQSDDTGLRVLWLTPLRALANDTAQSLQEPLESLGLPWTIGVRTGDTSSAERQRQRKRLPTALITTPESLSLLLTYKDAAERFGSLRCVIIDEWHELLSSKRGVQAELCLARLRTLSPQLRTWGLSATLGNTDESMRVLLGSHAAKGKLIRGAAPKDMHVDTVRPHTLERFPWAGHLGTKLLPQVLDAIDAAASTLLFTNTRSQAELWFQAIVKANPAWVDRVALHHGSIDFSLRKKIEDLLRIGEMKCVVCTSSLDLGVDFSPVDQVIQVGSPKGVARMMQRAGRSGHQPGAVSRILGVPAHAIELIEFAAARKAARLKRIESRPPIERPLDLLAQHLVTLGVGDGFHENAMLEEVRTTHAYRNLTDQEWRWTMDFVTRGGASLGAYPQFSRLQQSDDDQKYRVASQKIARLHRMSVGTITSDASIRVRIIRGKNLGMIEESFISRLRPGDRFVFAGRVLELVRVRDMTAQVRQAKQRSGIVPRWMGGRSPLSTQLANTVREQLDDARRGFYDGPEMELVRPLLELQARWSRIPAPDELLIERSSYRGAHHCFIFSFAGRLVHEGLSALIAHRVTQIQELSLNVTANDYGFELMSPTPLSFDETEWRELLTPDNLIEDLLACLNATELAKRRFRGIARVAGLIFPGYPGQAKSTRHLQASSDLFYDVFAEFDPDNLLLDQAKREVLERELEVSRLTDTLKRLRDERLTIVETERFSPLAFPLWADRIRSQQLSSEDWSTRIERMAAQLERAAMKETKDRRRRVATTAG